MHTVGGPINAYGMARAATGEADWREIVSGLVQSSDVILVLPSDSPGLQWELSHLKKEQALDRTVFVMMPQVKPEGCLSGYFVPSRRDAAGNWSISAAILAELQIYVPPYDPDGQFLLMDNGGTVKKTLPMATLYDGQFTDFIVQRFG
jgi:hypothetical protein